MKIYLLSSQVEGANHRRPLGYVGDNEFKGTIKFEDTCRPHTNTHTIELY